MLCACLAGLAACASSAQGIERIYRIKGRPSNLPLAVCVADAGDVGRYAECAHLPAGLLEALLPGPVTLLLQRHASSPLAKELNPGVATIGMCCHQPMRRWLRCPLLSLLQCAIVMSWLSLPRSAVCQL